MRAQPTIAIAPLEGRNAIVLRWNAWIDEFDVPGAFHDLTAELDHASLPVHVIVDLIQNPNLPLATTIHETLSGPFLHPMMGEWLVVGSNHRAEIVARTITAVGLRTNIHWFDTLADALGFLETLEAHEATRRTPAFDGV